MSEPLLTLIQNHLEKYPLLRLQDCIKLLYQRIRGSEHMLMQPDICYEMLVSEKEKTGTDTGAAPYEVIGQNTCRFQLLPLSGDSMTLRTLSRLFLESMKTLSANPKEQQEAFETALEKLEGWIQEGLLPFSQSESIAFLNLYRKKGCPSIHHSQTYAAAYHPAYRLLRTDYAHYFPLLAALDRLLAKKAYVILAVDGKCGAGKSTLASLLAELYSCDIVHMDDFFLPAMLRTPDRLQEAGGNLHYERFKEQVLPALLALKEERDFSFPVEYQVFDCYTMAFKPQNASLTAKPLTIVEGSYSMRPEFQAVYDLKVFLDISPKTQKERLLSRNGEEAWRNFEQKWIPMEQRYFDVFEVAQNCDLIFQNDSF